MTRVGLVLGAGGIAGQAYHAGVLAALEHDLGWDPRSAAVIVGTSAGSVTATLLRLGVPASELAAWAVRAPLSLDQGPVRDWLLQDRPTFPPFTLRHWLRPWRRPSPALVARLARRPWAVRPSVAAMTMMPPGRVDLLDHTAILDVLADEWLANLWVCAARRDDGVRVVFGRPGAPEAPMASAVAASCAIPGFFAPVAVGGVEYFDGGVHSPTNADVLAALGLDLVVVVSPMSTAERTVPSADIGLRFTAHRRLERELAPVRARGTRVVTFEPGRGSLAAMGVNMMADDRTHGVVQAAFIEAGSHAATDHVATRLSGLGHASAKRSSSSTPAGLQPAPAGG